MNDYNNELMLAILERTNKRQWIIIIILIVLFVGTNAGWIYRESQFTDEVVTTTVTQDVDSDNNGDAVINDGVHINGTNTTDGDENN